MNDETNKNIIEEILRIRLSQLIVNEQYKMGRFKIPIHLALGHEAIAAAVSYIMQKSDSLLLTHRNIAYNLAREENLASIINEYDLTQSGLSNGKFGSMNLANPSKGVIYTSSILAGQFSVAIGVGMVKNISEQKGISIVLGGDGSMEEGTFYESMLMAKSMKVPVMFIIENNGWSMATHITERRVPIDLSLFSKSFDVRYDHLTGNNVFQYIEKLAEIREFSTKNNEPVCVEVDVTTLGDTRAPATAEQPDGRFINYHSGPVKTISIDEQVLIKEGAEDPIFILKGLFPDNNLYLQAQGVLKKIQENLV